MSLAKRRMASGVYGLEANYISTENGTSTPSTSFTGQYVYCVQYNVAKCTVNSNVNGTIYFDYSDDGTTTRITVSDSIVGGVPYFRGVTIEDQFMRIRWSSVTAPTTLVIYTSLSKSSGGGLLAPVPNQIVGGSGISVTGPNPYTVTNSAPDQTVALSAGTGISVTGTYPSFTITNTASVGTNSCIFMTKTRAQRSTGGLYFAVLGGDAFNGVTTFQDMGMVVPQAGTFSSIFVKVNTVYNQNRTYTMFLNGSSTSFSAVLIANTTTISNTVNTLTVAAGDLVAWRVTDLAASTFADDQFVSCVFTI